MNNQDVAPRHAHPEKRRLWKASNVFFVLAMGVGSIGYGYSANVMAATLAQPTFIEYFDLDKRSNANALTAAMTVCPTLFQHHVPINPLLMLFVVCLAVLDRPSLC